jgi:hypothetical protein
MLSLVSNERQHTTRHATRVSERCFALRCRGGPEQQADHLLAAIAVVAITWHALQGQTCSILLLLHACVAALQMLT